MRKIKDSKYKLFSDLAMPKRLYSQGETIKMQILKKCNIEHPMYGEIKVNQKYFDNVVANFDNKIPKEDLPVNEEHNRTKAQARFRKVYQEGNKLYADLELTKDGSENINGGHYKYFSIEIFDKYQDQENLEKYENVLVGGAFTNYPFFRGMEKAFNDPTDETDNIYLSFKNPVMKEIKELLAKFKAEKKLTFSDKKTLIVKFSELEEDEQKEVAEEVEEAVETVEEAKEEPKAEEKEAEKEEPKEEPKAEEPQTHSVPELEKMKQEIAQLKADKRFSEIEKKFSSIELLGKNEKFGDMVKVFSKMDEDDEDALHKFFSNLNEVVNTLTQGQISKEYSKKEDKKENKKDKDGKEIITEDEMSEKTAEYAEKNKVSKKEAYEAIKEKYRCK